MGAAPLGAGVIAMWTDLLAAALWLFAAPVGSADALAQHRIGEASRVWITGASNIRRFTCRAREVSGSLDLRATVTRGATLAGENAALSASVSVPVAGLDCGIGRMSRHLQETLRAADYPTIDFRLVRYDIDFSGEMPTARVVGRLVVAGVEHPVEVVADVRADSLGLPHVQGAYPVRMTDYGVRPPTRFAGLLRVRDRIIVHFDIVPVCDDGQADLTASSANDLLWQE